MTTRRNLQMYARTTDRKMGTTRDGVLRRTKVEQVMEGTTAGIWTVTSEIPTRNTNNVLVWDCQCARGHSMKIEHALLAYGTEPTQCLQCVTEDQERAAALKAHEHRVLAECRAEISKGNQYAA